VQADRPHIRSKAMTAFASASSRPAVTRKTLRLPTIIEQRPMTKEHPRAPVHPGEILREEYLEPLGITPYALAAALHVPRTRVERLVREETSVTADTALRLGRYFGTTPEFWLGIQARFDVETLQKRLDHDIAAIEPLRKPDAASPCPDSFTS